MSIIRKISITLICATFFLCYFGIPQAFAVTNLHDLTTGKGTVTGSFMNQFGAKIYENSQSIILYIGNIIAVVLGFLGVLMVGIIIYSGFLWMTAGGEKEKIESAQKHLRGAIIGAIIVVSAWTITTFVMTALGGAATQ